MRDKLGLKDTIPYRRELRKNQTAAELLFWSQVSNRQFLGLKFVKQHGIGPYIVDFCCRSLGLVVEIDGDDHYTSQGIYKDKNRSEYLNFLGFVVVRYTNLEVIQNIDGVFEDLKSHIDLLPTSSLKGGGVDQNRRQPAVAPPFKEGLGRSI